MSSGCGRLCTSALRSLSRNLRAFSHTPSIVSFTRDDVLKGILGEFGVETGKEL